LNTKVGTLDQQRAHSKRKTFDIPVGRILLIQHIIKGGNLPVRVGNLRTYYLDTREFENRLAYNGELNIGRSKLGAIFVDILDPCIMIIKAVGGDANDLDATRSEIRSTTSDFTKLSRADGREITRVREQNGLGYN